MEYDGTTEEYVVNSESQGSSCQGEESLGDWVGAVDPQSSTCIHNIGGFSCVCTHIYTDEDVEINRHV